MAQFDYAKAAATAQRLITRFGQSVTLTVSTTSGGDPWNPTTVIDTDYTLKAAVMSFKAREIDGTLIKATDKKVIVSTEGASVEPDVSHSMTIGGVSHSIVAVTPLNPGGTVVYWTLQVRK